MTPGALSLTQLRGKAPHLKLNMAEKFTADITPSAGVIVLKDKKGGEIEVSLAETGSLIDLFNWTKTLLTCTVLPPYIEGGNFRANFNETGGIRLGRVDLGGSILYTGEDILELVQLIKQTRDQAKDWRSLGKKKTFRGTTTTDPPS